MRQENDERKRSGGGTCCGDYIFRCNCQCFVVPSGKNYQLQLWVAGNLVQQAHRETLDAAKTQATFCRCRQGLPKQEPRDRAAIAAIARQETPNQAFFEPANDKLIRDLHARVSDLS